MVPIMNVAGINPVDLMHVAEKLLNSPGSRGHEQWIGQ